MMTGIKKVSFWENLFGRYQEAPSFVDIVSKHYKVMEKLVKDADIIGFDKRDFTSENSAYRGYTVHSRSLDGASFYIFMDKTNVVNRKGTIYPTRTVLSYNFSVYAKTVKNRDVRERLDFLIKERKIKFDADQYILNGNFKFNGKMEIDSLDDDFLWGDHERVSFMNTLDMIHTFMLFLEANEKAEKERVERLMVMTRKDFSNNITNEDGLVFCPNCQCYVDPTTTPEERENKNVTRNRKRKRA